MSRMSEQRRRAAASFKTLIYSFFGIFSAGIKLALLSGFSLSN